MLFVLILTVLCWLPYSGALRLGNASNAVKGFSSTDGQIDIKLGEVLQQWQENTDSTCLWNLNNIQELCSNETQIEFTRLKQKSSSFAQTFINSAFVDLFCDTFNGLVERIRHQQRRDAENQIQHLKRLSDKMDSWIKISKNIPKELLKDAVSLYHSILYSIEQLKSLIRQTNNVQWPVESVSDARRDLLFGLTERFFAPSVLKELKLRAKNTPLEDSLDFIERNREELRQMIRRNYNLTESDKWTMLPEKIIPFDMPSNNFETDSITSLTDGSSEHGELVDATCKILLMIKGDKECEGLDRKIYKTEKSCCDERIHEFIPKRYQNKFEVALSSGDIAALTYTLTVTCNYRNAVFLTYTLLDLHKMVMAQQFTPVNIQMKQDDDDNDVNNDEVIFEASLMETVFYLLHQTIAQSDCALLNKDN